MANAYDYKLGKWVSGPAADKIIAEQNAHHKQRFSGMTPEQRLESLYKGADIHARRHGLPKEQIRAEYLKSAQDTFPESFPKENASGLETTAKKMLAEKSPEDPFEKLNRDLPKGGRQMKIAEPLGETALPAAAAAGSRLVAPAVAAGMLIPSSIGAEQPIVDTGNKGVAGPLPQELKGSPVMQDMAGPTKMTKEQQLMKRFVEEGKKNISPDFSVDVPVEYTDEGTGEHENYTLGMKSKKPLSEMDKMKAAGIDASLGRTGGKINMPKNSKSNKVMLEEDED